MKKLLLTLLVVMVATAVNAERVSKQDALQKARMFMPDKQFAESKSFARSAGSAGEEAFYVFNADGHQGFVIVSGDDRTPEIIGYSLTGSLDMERMPDNLKWWLDCYARQMEALGSSAKPAQKSKTRGASSWKAVNPLIKTQWNQYEPYNLKCPDRTGKDWRDAGFDAGNVCVTGCVAAAMAQIMYYWECPESCPAIPAYTTYTYRWSMKALPATTFKWSQMLKTYNGSETGASAEAIAELLRYCGQAVNMDYDLDGSSAAASAAVMSKYFGFGKNARQVFRSLYSLSVWEDMIYNELSENRPVLYGGSSISGGADELVKDGHQFIVDGYDGKGLFHMNWGWGGMSDGYFVLSLANPDEVGAGGGTSADGYSWEQHAIIGLMPDNGEPEKPQFYGGFYQDLEQDVFTRGSASEDFVDVAIPGYVFFEYNDPDIPAGEYSCSFKVAWGLYQNGSLLKVLGATDLITLENNCLEDNWNPFSFGSDLADGRYQLRPIYQLAGSDWQLCEMPNDDYGSPMIVFADAVISGNKLTLRESSGNIYTSNITVNEVTYSPSELEVGKPVEVTVNLTNNGDAFQELLFLSCGSENTVVCGSVEAGQTGNVRLHFTPTKAGTKTLKISTDYEATDVVWSEAVTVEAAKPHSLSGKMVIDNFEEDKMVLLGTSLKVTAQITNKGVNDYDNVIELDLYKNTDPSSDSFGGPFVMSKSVMATIPVGETREVDFVIKDLNPDDEYFFFVNYSSAGEPKRLLTGYPFTLTEETDTSVDVTTLVQLIMAGQYDEKADLNKDNKVDAADLVLLINMLK
jgi:hypothetical protein